MRLFPFKQAGVSGVDSKESDSAHTLARSGTRLMSYTPMTQDTHVSFLMVPAAPHRIDARGSDSL